MLLHIFLIIWLFIIKDKFIYLKVTMTERGREEEEREERVSHMLVYSPSDCMARSGSEMRPAQARKQEVGSKVEEPGLQSAL